MWVFFAFGSAFFAGLTAVLAKCEIKETDSNVATAIRTVVVLAFSWLMVFLVGSQSSISFVSAKTWVFLILSGIAAIAVGTYLMIQKKRQTGRQKQKVVCGCRMQFCPRCSHP